MADVTNYTIENNSGANVRIDLNNVFAAIQSSNSKSTDLATSQCVAGMPFLNTTTNILKIRNSSNGGFTEIGNIDTANLGLLPAGGGTMTGALLGHDGSNAAAPAFSFDTDTDLGLFRKAANIMGFSSAGTEQMVFDANGITLRQQNEIRFGDNDSSNYVGIKAPATVSSNLNFVLPSADGSNGQFLKTNGSGTLSFATAITSLANLNASNLSSGTVPDARFPATLPAISGANLTNISGAAVKAFVNFRGTGTVAINADLNVSSITDNGTGDYTVNFTNNISDANYTPVCMTHGHDTQGTQIQTVVRGMSNGADNSGPTLMTTSACRINRGYTSSNAFQDGVKLFFAVLR